MHDNMHAGLKLSIPQALVQVECHLTFQVTPPRRHHASLKLTL
jgi:hypothetical protein